MPSYGFLVVMGPENFRIFLQHVLVNVYKISNHPDMVMFFARRNGMECIIYDFGKILDCPGKNWTCFLRNVCYVQGFSEKMDDVQVVLKNQLVSLV